MKFKVVTFDKKSVELDIPEEKVHGRDVFDALEEKFKWKRGDMHLCSDKHIIYSDYAIDPNKTYFLSLNNSEVDKLIGERPAICVNVVVTEGPMRGKKIVIKDVTDETDTKEFIEKIRDRFKLKDVFASFFFPSNTKFNAYVNDYIYCYRRDPSLSLYSLCLGGNKSVSMVVVPYEEIHFNIKMKVNNKYDIELKDIKGSATVSDLIKIIEKTSIEGYYDYLIINDHVCDERTKIVDIVSPDLYQEIVKSENIHNYSLFWNVDLIKRSIHGDKPLEIRMCGSSSIIVYINSETTVGQLKVECGRYVGFQHQLVLSYAGKAFIDNSLLLSSYPLTKYSVVYCSYSVRGGGGSFVDVERTDKLVSRPFSSDAPVWRYCTNGANVEGICENKQCIAYHKPVISELGYGRHDVLDCKRYHCPICGCIIRPYKPSFSNCVWKVEYVRKNGISSYTSWNRIGNKYQTYDEIEAGMVEYSSVIVQAEELDSFASFDEEEEEDGICCYCHLPFLSRSEENKNKEMKKELLSCHHKAHSKCIKEWCHDKKCKKSCCCPLCDIIPATA